MALQLSDSVRNARINTVESTIGASSVTLEVRTGAPPANCAAADTGSLLATITIPADWMNAASGGSATKNGTWQVNASGTGTAGHFRIKQSTTTHIQGTITASGGGGDMLVDNTSIASGQQVTVSTFTITDANA